MPAPPGSIILEGGGSRVEVVPEHGGRVRSLQLGGREWLLQGDPRVAPSSALPPFAGAGWDECAPAAGGGVMPEWVKGVGGRPIPLGGEARLQHPEAELHTADEGHQLKCSWHGERLPWTLSRTLLVRRDGAVEARYEALTTGQNRLPFLWSAQLMFPLSSGTRLRFPEAGRIRVVSGPGSEAGPSVGEGKWPRLSLQGRSCDLSSPWTLPGTTLFHSWLDLAGGRSTLHLVQDGAQLTISTDGAGIPHCGLAVDRGGRRAGKRRIPFMRGAQPGLALMPSLGAPDRYGDALGDWQSVTWLVPGEPRRWTMILRATT